MSRLSDAFLSHEAAMHRVLPRRRSLRPLSLEALEARTVLSTITVTSLADSGAGSLREAITEANGTIDPDTIEFASTITGKIALQSSLPDVSGTLSLVGPGSAVLSVARDSGDGSPFFRLLNIESGALVSISGLTLTGGFENSSGGGAVFNAGSLTITNSVLSGNQAATGGAIVNRGTLTVAGSTLSDNIGLTGGGAIQNDQGTMTITDCLITGNRTVVGGSGGGVYNAGNFTFTDPNVELPAVGVISHTVIRGNSAGNAGGGLSNGYFSSLTVIGCTIDENHAGGTGGGIYAAGHVVVAGTTISHNEAPYGGGINVNFGTLTLTNSTVDGNHSGGDGGGLNIYDRGSAMILDATIAENTAGFSGNGANVEGSLTVQSTILDNGLTNNVVTQREGAIITLGHNLFSDTPSITLDPTDLVNTDPLLGPLADNGGPTQTMALLPGSPAIDAGVMVAGVTTDQRGIARPQGTAPDIGAFESRGFSIAVGGGNGQGAVVGTAFASPLVVTVSSPYGEPVSGGVVTFRAPASGPSAGLSASSVAVGSDGQASVNAVANGLTGVYSVTTQSGGLTGPAFSLTNLATPPPPASPTPVVAGLQRFGVHMQPTSVVVRFSRAMDAGRANDLTNYRLVSAGRDGKLGTRDDRVIRLRSVRYDDATQSVRIAPGMRLPLAQTYQLTIVGTPPGGLIGTDGVYLGGAGADRAGTDYVATFDRSALVIPAPAVRAHHVRTRRAHHKP